MDSGTAFVDCYHKLCMLFGKSIRPGQAEVTFEHVKDLLRTEAEVEVLYARLARGKKMPVLKDILEAIGARGGGGGTNQDPRLAIECPCGQSLVIQKSALQRQIGSSIPCPSVRIDRCSNFFSARHLLGLLNEGRDFVKLTQDDVVSDR